MTTQDTLAPRGQDELAELVESDDGRHCLRLPADRSERAVTEFFRGSGVQVRIERGGDLGGAEWRLVIGRRDLAEAERLLARRECRVARVVSGGVGFTFPLHHIAVRPGFAFWVRAALDQVTPERFGPDGLPLPWVPGESSRAALVEREGDDVDIVDGVLPALAELVEVPERDLSQLTTAQIRAVFDDLRRRLGLAGFPLVVRRGGVDRHGFVSGRVAIATDGTPRRMSVVTCPNADLAEAAATLVHEFAHIVAFGDHHGAGFKEALVALAELHYGQAAFAQARLSVGGSYRTVDQWVATGIRAVLRDARVPRPRESDEARIAASVAKIGKLRALAASQPGAPEAVTATATANDMIAVYDLGGYEVEFDGGLDDQMVDRWLDIGKRQVWKRSLSFTIAEFYDVFALSRSSKGWMHLFGTYTNVTSAMYLYRLCVESLERRCEVHVAQWKRGRDVARGETTRERTSFLDSAASGVAIALRAAREDKPRVEPAEEFAAEEFFKRGRRWGSSSGKAQNHNQSGFDAGRAVGAAGARPSGSRGLLK